MDKVDSFYICQGSRLVELQATKEMQLVQEAGVLSKGGLDAKTYFSLQDMMSMNRFTVERVYDMLVDDTEKASYTRRGIFELIFHTQAQGNHKMVGYEDCIKLT